MLGSARRILACLPLLLLAACERADDARRAEIVDAITRADYALLRARPGPVAGQYAPMAAGAYDFYRGSLSIFARDFRNGALSLSRSRFDVDLPLVPGLGDAHPENFGTLRAADGVFSLEPNDF